MAKQDFDIKYDRVVAPDFLEHFLPRGVAASLAHMAGTAAYPLDLQFRKDPKTGRQWATMYAGLTAVLNVQARTNGLRLSAHDTWAKNPKYGFRQSWKTSGLPACIRPNASSNRRKARKYWSMAVRWSTSAQTTTWAFPRIRGCWKGPKERWTNAATA